MARNFTHKVQILNAKNAEAPPCREAAHAGKIISDKNNVTEQLSVPRGSMTLFFAEMIFSALLRSGGDTQS